MVKNKDFENLSKELRSINAGVSAAFSQVKDELSDHLDAINQNTAEFDIVHQRITSLETMFEKIVERLDELSMTSKDVLFSESDFNVELSLREQEVFVILYTSKQLLSAKKIVKYLGLTEELVHNYIFKLISKGIPVIKQFDKDGVLLYSLDKMFKDLQARKNLIKINSEVLDEFNLKKEIY